MGIVYGQPRRPGDPFGMNPGGGYGGYTGPKGTPGQGSYGQQYQGGVDLNTGQRIPPGGGLINGLPGHMVQEAGGYGEIRPGMAAVAPPRQTYQPPPPPPSAARAAPAAPSHAGFNGVVAPTPGNGMPGWSTNNPIGAKSSAQSAGAAWSWSGSGGGGQAYTGPTPVGSHPGDPRPTAWGGVGTITPGGGGGGGAGAASAGNVGNQAQKYYDEANAANEGRYNQLLGMAGQLSDAGMQRENRRQQDMLGRVDQHAISSGLGNTTVLPTLERGVIDDSALRQEEIADQGLKTKMGIVERRSDIGPDLGLLAQLASRPGAAGGYGALNPYGASLGPIGSPATHHGASTRGGGSLAGALAPSQGTNDYTAGGWANGGPGGGGAGRGGLALGGTAGGIGGSGMVDGYGGNFDAAGGGTDSYDQNGNPVSLAPGGVRYNQYGEMVDEFGNLI